ncbi:MAG: ArsA family ATPase [Chloroflexota bacterium]
MRIMLYTGKGGVGKTSVSAATALRTAELGYRTIVLSTDAAHSLADSFDRPLSSDPIEIGPNLWAQELDILHQMDLYWGTVQKWLQAVALWQGVNHIVADEVTVLPGMEEIASLLQIVYLYDTGKYDVIVVDCAPTGETLRLLTFPEVTRWWLEHLLPLQRKAAGLVRPLMRQMIDMPLPGDEVFASVQKLFADLERMRHLLNDKELSSVRLVVNPEKMVIKEAQRTFAYLNLFDYNTDAVLVNRVVDAGAAPAVLPEEERSGGEEYSRQALRHWYSWGQMQRPYLQLIEDSFAPVPIFRCPFFDQEVVGEAMLRQMAAQMYGDTDPAAVLHRGRTQTLEKADGRYVLSLPLPLVAKGQIDLTRTGDELIVRIGNHKRNLVLPRTLAGLEVTEARLDEGTLRITFAANGVKD